MLAYSISELIDKLCVTHLKLWHVEEEIGNRRKAGLPAEEIEPLCNQVVTLNDMRVRIVDSIKEFFDEVPAKSEAIIAGDGGLAKVLTDVITSSEVIGYIGLTEGNLLGKPIYTPSILPEDKRIILGVLNPLYREKYVKTLGAERFLTIKEGIIAKSAQTHNGSVVMRGSYVMAQAEVGPFAHIHTGSMIGHDCKIEDFSFVGPGCIAGGYSRIGPKCRLGMGCRIMPKVTIGSKATVAAGAVVNHDVPPGATVGGIPAKEIAKTEFERF